MVKTLRCSSCGAGLRNESGQPNVICEYCNSFVRVSDDKRPQIDISVAISQMMGLWVSSNAKDKVDISEEYKYVAMLMENHRYVDAKKRIDKILSVDATQSRAWFYKSLLPVLEQESILFKGSYINIMKLSQITKRQIVHKYLRLCGLKPWHHRAFLKHYRSTDFLYEQHMKHLDNAIQYESSQERLDFLKEHKQKRIEMQKRKLRRRRLSTFGLITLLVLVFGGACLALWYFYFRQGIF